MKPLLELTGRGLYCAAGDFFVDPWRPVERAVITHAHSDHAKPGSRAYLTAATGAPLLRERVGPHAAIQPIAFGQTVHLGDASVSLHPAGHLLGSAQVRVESRGEVWVVSGDYKNQADATCESFEPVPCHTFITESTFGLPIYRWRPQKEIFAEINSWWRANQAAGCTSVLLAYALGKAQRVLGGLDPSIGPILAHGAVARFLPAYAGAGIQLPPVQDPDPENIASARGRAIVVAPPQAARSAWIQQFAPLSTAFASGWMQLRTARRQRGFDCGFVLSDHADWDGLMETIRATGAERILVTHGYTEAVVRWLCEQGYQAQALHTRFSGAIEEDSEPREAV